MALTKTPFLLTLITTMHCGAAHKKPLVGRKNKSLDTHRRAHTPSTQHWIHDLQHNTSGSRVYTLIRWTTHGALKQSRVSAVPAEDISVPESSWLQLDSFFQLLLALTYRILLSRADFLVTWRTRSHQAYLLSHTS